MAFPDDDTDGASQRRVNFAGDAPPNDLLRNDSGSGSLRRRNSGGRGSAWTSSVHVPASDIPIGGGRSSMSRQGSNILAGQTSDPDIGAVPDVVAPGISHNSSLAASKRLVREKNVGDEEDAEENFGGGGSALPEMGSGEADARMSLMSLLAESDEQQETGGLAYMMGANEEEDEDEDDDDDEGGGGGEGPFKKCCVCMVKHKAAAFEPCGHSFCRLCSREMRVEPGNCPLCSNYILEILDVF